MVKSTKLQMVSCRKLGVIFADNDSTEVALVEAYLCTDLSSTENRQAEASCMCDLYPIIC